MNEGKILLLDDNKDLLLIVQIILKGQGYDTVQAGCIEEGLQKIRIHKPSLILMDVFIKDEDGRELCSRLKHDADTASTRIIMMSGIESDNEQLYQIGADDFMQKPFDYDDLISRVNRQMTAIEAWGAAPSIPQGGNNQRTARATTIISLKFPSVYQSHF